jgi:hypothetical protein
MCARVLASASGGNLWPRVAVVSLHKFKIGQLVNYLGRDRALGVYQITQLVPLEGEVQYRIRNLNEPDERVAKESELRKA